MEKKKMGQKKKKRGPVRTMSKREEEKDKKKHKRNRKNLNQPLGQGFPLKREQKNSLSTESLIETGKS